VADDGPGSDEPSAPATPVALSTIAAAWGRIGCLGFGGPPAHIALLRALCVERHGWIDEATFEHGIAATNVLPGPASTQLAIWCAWRLRRTAGAVVGGLAFILPGLVIILALAALFLQGHPPRWVEGIALGLGAAVAAVALNADGVLIEVHPNPAEAWSDGQQQVDFNLYAKLVAELKPFVTAVGRPL